LSGRRAKKPIHDGSQKNELNGYSGALNELKELLGDAIVNTLPLVPSLKLFFRVKKHAMLQVPKNP
jgi:hypothetical protein